MYLLFNLNFSKNNLIWKVAMYSQVWFFALVRYFCYSFCQRKQLKDFKEDIDVFISF